MPSLVSYTYLSTTLTCLFISKTVVHFGRKYRYDQSVCEWSEILTFFPTAVDTPPVMNTCQVSMIDVGNTEKKSGYTGNVTDCSHQRDEVINTQPTQLTFKIGAYLNLSMGTQPSYIRRSEVGVVGTKVSVVKIALNGEFTVCLVHVLIFIVSSQLVL